MDTMPLTIEGKVSEASAAEPAPDSSEDSSSPTDKADVKKSRKKKGASKTKRPKGLSEFQFAAEISVAAGTRFIGIRHRIKQTKDGDARPTQVAIFLPDGDIRRLDLETEGDELNWVNGVYVTKSRSLSADEDLDLLQEVFAKHCESVHLAPPPSDPKFGTLFKTLCKMRELKKKDAVPTVHASQLMIEKGKTVAVITDVPVSFDGLMAGDNHVMSLGGSGDRLAYALSRRSEHIQEKTGLSTGVFRTPPRILKDHRDAYIRDKDTDALSVVELFVTARSTFYECDVRDRLRIDVSEHVRNRRDTQDDRKRCEQRLRQRVIGGAFIREGLYPEGSLEDRFRDARANDAALTALEAEEAKRDKAVETAIEKVDVYTEILATVTGVGPITGAELFAAIGDIRRFQVHPDQGLLDQLRFESRRCFDEGNLLENALDVLVTAKHVRREKSWVDLVALLSLVAKLRTAKQDFNGAADLCRAIAEIETLTADSMDLDVDRVVNEVREICRKSGLREELFEVRDRKVMDRFLFIGAVAAFKRANGKTDESEKIRQGLDFMKQAGKLKWKARERSKAKLRHHCGVHVRHGGKYADVPPDKAFPRTRRGEVCNWNRMARQRLYLLVADQFNKRPGTEWGDRLRAIKVKRREIHPEPVKVEVGERTVLRHTDGHVHKSSIWRCASKFVDWLYDEWMKLEESHKRKATVGKA